MTANRASPTTSSPILNIKIRAKRKQELQEKKQQESRYVSFFPLWVQSGHFCLPRRNPEDGSSLIYYLSHSNNLLCFLSTRQASLSVTDQSNCSRLDKSLQIHAATFSQLHEFLSPSCWIPILPLPTQLKHKKLRSRKKHDEQQVHPWAQPMTE